MLFEGKSPEEAIKRGLEHYGITREQAVITVINSGKRIGGISIGKASVSIEPKKEPQIATDGSYEILYREDGVYIEVYPEVGAGRKVKLQDVEERLEYKKVQQIDREALIKAVAAAEDEPIKIAPSQKELKFDARLEVEINKDSSCAYATIIPPDGGKQMTVEKAMETLKSNGVVAGLNTELIDELVTEDIYGKPKPVAEAVQPVDGKDGYVEHRVSIDEKIHPRISEDGTVNFHDLGLIQNIRKGQILAILHDPTPGKDGVDVRGNVLKAKAGVPARLPKGNNTEITDDGKKLVSLIEGQLIISNGKIGVMPVYEVKGNVDNSTGNIKFVGKVVVRGNVLTGFKIEAEGDIEVDGVVEGARLKSEGNILLKRGAQGSGKGFLECKGNLISKFIENCTVEADGDVEAEAIMHSKVSSGSKIILKGRKGLLVGGISSARSYIVAKTIGSPMATLTRIEVGVDPQLRRDIETESKKMDRDKKALEQANLNISSIAKMAKQGYITQGKKVILKKSAALKKQLEATIAQREKRLIEMNEQLNLISKGYVKVEGAVLPGTIITIGSSTMSVKDKIEYALFYREGGEVRIGTFER